MTAFLRTARQVLELSDMESRRGNAAFVSGIVLLFIFMAATSLLTGYLPTHDAIEFHGLSHYFYTSLERGVIPYWNPYSQTGTPFFNNYQSFQLLLPSQFAFVLFQKVTGCTSLTAYVLHHFFMYFVFILGAYFTIRIITRNNSVGFLFAIVLLMACFPVFMRMAAIHCLIPLITYFLLLFLQEQESFKKGLYLFVVSYIISASLNVYIPVWLLFYLLVLVPLLFIFKAADIRHTFQFLMSRTGLSWLGTSAIVSLCVAAPVFALYNEIRYGSVYIPTIRFLQKNGNNLVKFFASDLRESLFSERFYLNAKISLTSANVAGLILEPFQHFIHGFVSSEVVLYVGVFSLMTVCLAVVKVRNVYTHIFLIIGGLTLLLSCNFKTQVGYPISIFQTSLLAVFPFLKMSDVFQNGGTLILFCLVILGARGFQEIPSVRGRKILLIVPLLLAALKYSLLPVVMAAVKYLTDPGFRIETSRDLLVPALLAGSIVAIIALALLAAKLLSRLGFARLYRLSIIILLVDLLIFAAFHVRYLNKVANRQYFGYVSSERLLKNGPETRFINYRVPFSFSGFEKYFKPLRIRRERLFNTFYGHEIYKVQKAAFPCAVHAMQAKSEDKRYFADWDHLYMTTYYYDYLVNLPVDKQLITSNVTSPILNFYRAANVVRASDKYDAIEAIRNSDADYLRKHLIIEDHIRTNRSFQGASKLFRPENHVVYTQKEMESLRDRDLPRLAPNPDVTLRVTDYDINHLRLKVDTPYDGYLYFGDGYNRHWKAFLDGKEARIEKANINFKSVRTPRGQHSIDFFYDPMLFRYSLYVYLIGNILFVTVLGVALARNWSRKRATQEAS